MNRYQQGWLVGPRYTSGRIRHNALGRPMLSNSLQLGQLSRFTWRVAGGAILGTPEVRGPWRWPRRLRYNNGFCQKHNRWHGSSMKLSNVEWLPVHIFAICFIRITVPREVRADVGAVAY